MRALLLLSAALLVSCSYGFGELLPYYERDGGGGTRADAHTTGLDGGPGVDAAIVHPRDALDPAWECNPVSHLGCGSGYCLGDIASDVAIDELVCRGSFGSGSFDTYCADFSFCVGGFLCWTDPLEPGATDGTCAEPCFDSSDCTPGYRCETESSYRATFAGTTMYRCVPGGV